MSLIEIDGLTKRYGNVSALEDLSISVESGIVYGFLGPNGAGKSTTINSMLDFTKPTSGSISIFGMDAQRQSRQIRRRTGCLLEGYGVYPRLTGREHVQHAIDVKGASDDPDELLDRVNLDPADRGRYAGEYSKGMRQRMAIAVSLVGNPDLLVLDEPSTGLDPNGARMLREVVREEAYRGASVFFSSHVLDDVEAVADEVGILLDGTLRAEGSLDELRSELGAGTTLRIEVSGVPDRLPERLREFDHVGSIAHNEGRLDVTCTGNGRTKLDVLTAVADAGVYRDFDVEEISLSDIFSQYTTNGDGAVSDDVPAFAEADS